jgi:predicted DNA-binding ribbon-helix-helix protein
MQSAILKRSIVIAGHKTSVSLENEFWAGLKEIAKVQKITLSELVGSIDSNRRHRNLSSSIRLFVLDHFRGRLAGLAAAPAAAERMAPAVAHQAHALQLR